MVEVSERRDDLLEKIADVLLADGVAESSLRPLAEKIGSSARLLIYHFETKEKLIKCALAVVRMRVEHSLQILAARKRPDSLKASLTMFWEWATQEPNQNYFRLLFEIDGLSMHNKKQFSSDFGSDDPTIWLQMIDRITKDFPRDRVSAACSTLIMAALNGLLQDFFSTGDRARTTAGLNYLIKLIMSGDQLASKK